MAETENATAVRNRVSNATSRASPIAIDAASATPAMRRSWVVSFSSCTVSGVFSSFVTWSMPLMCPTSVDIPVAIATIVPAPRVTWVFMKARSTRSPRAASAATPSTCFGTGALSPVRADSSISSVAARMIRPSAGTRSPASMLTMSPGTRSSIGISISSPPRRTFAFTTIIFWSAATLADALPSWLRPMAALSSVRTIRTTAVSSWFGRNRLTIPATSRTTCIGSRYWRTNACQRGSLAAVVEPVGSIPGTPRVDLGRGQADRWRRLPALRRASSTVSACHGGWTGAGTRASSPEGSRRHLAVGLLGGSAGARRPTSRPSRAPRASAGSATRT